MAGDGRRAGWDRSDGSYWARPEHLEQIEGDYPSQDRVRLDPKLVEEIREDERDDAGGVPED
jgi:hypothetical protein